MATLIVYERDVDPVFVAASGGGDSFTNNGDTQLLVMNAGVSSITVTIAAARNCDHGFLDDEVVTIGAGELDWSGPFPHARFGDSQRVVNVTYSATTGVSVSVQKLR